ncbi:TraR/DksA C4-type zinc finger protein [Alkalimonas collagenimarina]|uniref:TraR/DksA C4-type zinc finger protein n=1 Tax=Alkalimonas collagenimarina TaxID=400390 RepID=A0ABT9H0J0_9GAMM|nr:TraR/DksA C4-type zinc finger protein [Alkalimonas collagenimarina]MDP4536841.1 TraR/DksA C4-type zinc finger protein [Alkalimonas collagenimarina]
MTQTERTAEQDILAMPDDHYMNAQQLAFFEQLLRQQKKQIQHHIEQIKQHLSSVAVEPDELDRALIEEDNRQNLRLVEREYFLLRKIEQALDRVARQEYGYCVETGQPIGIRRLLARPTAELCLEAKERQEIREKHYKKQRG